jgi:5-methylcytosine-specific restriction endonuclease McrA
MPVSRSRAARASRKRKRRMYRVEHDLTDEQWSALKAAWGGCAYCGATDRPLQRDCVLPISRGGRYTLDNVAPACGACNASKCNEEVTHWLRRKRLDERTFLLRHAALGAELRARVGTPTSGDAGRPSGAATATSPPESPGPSAPP